VRTNGSDGWFCGIVRVRGLGQIRVWFLSLGPALGPITKYNPLL